MCQRRQFSSNTDGIGLRRLQIKEVSRFVARIFQREAPVYHAERGMLMHIKEEIGTFKGG